MSFEAARLPTEHKRQLCWELLGEFGATNITERGDELHHSCVLPLGGHARGDRRPSASLNFEKLVYKCLGCGNSGGLTWFVAVCRGEPGGSASQWLATRTGTEGQIPDLDSLLASWAALFAPATPEPLPHFDPGVLAGWDWLERTRVAMGGQGTVPPGAVEWLGYLLLAREIPLDNLATLRVGWDPDRHRVVLPHFWRGQLVGWQSRRIRADGTPKYLSSPELPKGQTLYRAPEGRRAVVVESPFSVLRHAHHTPMLATFGHDLTEGQVRLLTRYDQLVIWLDNDESTWSILQGSSRRGRRKPGLLERLAPHSDLRVVASSWAQDPGDLDDQTVQGLIDTAVPWSTWRAPKEVTTWPSPSTAAAR